MPTKRKVTVLDRQTLVDIALQEHGSIEALFTVVKEAGLASVTDTINAGQLLTVVSDALDREPPALYKATGRYPTTGDILVFTPFVCAGIGYGSFTTLGPVTFDVQTDTGFVTIRHSNSGIVYNFGDGGVPDVTVTLTYPGSYCMWASYDAEGTPGAGILMVSGGPDAINLKTLDLRGYDLLINVGFTGTTSISEVLVGADNAALGIFSVTGAQLTTLNLSACPALKSLVVNDNALLTTVQPPSGQQLINVQASGCALTASSVDALINACDPTWDSGNLGLAGGTNAAPTATSAANLAAIEATVDMVVSGAGTAIANGTYPRIGTLNGRPQYERSGGTQQVAWDGTKWVLSTTSGSYRANQDVPKPWLGTWTLFGASAPVPTFTAAHTAWFTSYN